MSKNINPKSIALIAIVAALLVLVLRDRSTANAESDASASPRQSFIDANTVTRSVEELIAQRDEWAAANQQARSAWVDAMSSIIKAPSVNVAESSLRATLEEAMASAGLTLSVSAPMPRQTPLDGEPLRVIGLTLDFDAPNPDAVYTLLDRIENAPAPNMVITDLEIRGPGRTGRDGLHIKMDVSTMAWIGNPVQLGGADG